MATDHTEKLAILETAMATTQAAYAGESTKRNLENWQAAEAAYLAALAECHDGESGGDGAVAWRDFMDTANRQEVYRWLQAAGYQVPPERTFYRHCKQGKLYPNEKGLYTRKLVKAYADTHLTGGTGGGESLETERILLQNEKLQDEIDRARFRDEIERGRYILRDEIDRIAAAKAVVLDRGVEHLLRSRARECAVAVGGDPERSGELVQLLLNGWHELLTGYASAKEFIVVFEPEQGEER